MDKYSVREKTNPLAVHCYTWSLERCHAWIDQYGDSKIFMDKTLTRDSFAPYDEKSKEFVEPA
jgi:hypothetical protein